MSKRISAALLSTVAAVGLGLTLAAPANAADRDGACNTGELCYYFNSNFGGSLSDFYGNDPNLVDDAFLSSGNGQGQSVKNNAAGAKNIDPSHNVTVWYNRDYNFGTYSGRSDTLPANSQDGVFDNVYNQNASHSWW
ncbi:peptidase inhibitor family I36 protein [Streptomyces vietnamensis]|uniref:peptidase inhibitor family I36 protein n=1 Tax=Streptomyces vietnamensis TaxID=362257 RepID=UPI00069677ED|nr:peptidase inhibitor family I36 protein [Streptomyces vietnamensis]